MHYVIGIDQGHTNTRAVVCDFSGQILGVGKTYGACHCHSGVEKALGAIRAAGEQAMDQAGIRAGQVAQIHSSMTGADWAYQYALCQGYLRSLGWTDAVTISNDCIGAMRGGTEQPYGAIYVAGSGANCAVRSPKGEEFIYGYFLDDSRQGAAALGRAALLAALNTLPGITPPNSLTERVLAHYHQPDLEALCMADSERRLEHINQLTPYVFEEAYYRHDPVAAEIIHTFALSCAEAVTCGLARFDMLGLEVEVVVSGSVFKGLGTLLIETFASGIHRRAPRAKVVSARYEPVVGAALLALETCGISVTGEVKANVERTALAMGQLRQEG
jgi:N-acetylglucosamine kinase-like BadF-type ATPase